MRGEHTFIMPLVLENLAPPFISIIGIGAVAAAVMSSTDSGLLSATSVFSSNIYKNILRKQVKRQLVIHFVILNEMRAIVMDNFPISQASDLEMQWVIRVTVVVVGIVGTLITFYTNSTLLLWLLGADIAYSLIFPHLVAVLFFKAVNGYGAMVGYIFAVTLRILLGENTIGLSAILHLPGCTLEDDIYVQRAPIRTVTMLCTLVTICIFSWLASFMFKHGLLMDSWDVFHVKHSENTLPEHVATESLRESQSEAECHENGQSVALQPMIQADT